MKGINHWIYDVIHSPTKTLSPREQNKLHKKLAKEARYQKKLENQQRVASSPPPPVVVQCANCDSLKQCRKTKYHRRKGGLCPERGELDSWFTKAFQNQQTPGDVTYSATEITEMKTCLRDREEHQKRCSSYCENGTCVTNHLSRREASKHQLPINLIRNALQAQQNQSVPSASGLV